MDILRQETIEDVKALSQLNRLKVTLVAGLAAVAFGVGPYSNIGKYSYLLLCWVPMVCAYIDFQYLHYLAKVFVRGAFLRNMQPQEPNDHTHQRYQAFVHLVRSELAPNLFSFEKKALLGSSVTLSLSPLLALPVIYFSQSNYKVNELCVLSGLIIMSSLIGITLIISSYKKYRYELHKVENYSHSYGETEQLNALEPLADRADSHGSSLPMTH